MEIVERASIDKLGRPRILRLYRCKCSYCGTGYLKQKALLSSTRYCSFKCKVEDQKKPASTCTKCGATTGDPRSTICMACFRPRVPEHTCLVCQKIFRPYHNKQAGRFCSAECRSVFQVGEQNPNYKNAEKGRFGHGWAAARKLTLERDGYRCQACNKDHGRMDVHHIAPYRICRSHDLDNLVTLCISCHKKLEIGLKFVERVVTRDEFLYRLYTEQKKIA